MSFCTSGNCVFLFQENEFHASLENVIFGEMKSISLHCS